FRGHAPEESRTAKAGRGRVPQRGRPRATALARRVEPARAGLDDRGGLLETALAAAAQLRPAIRPVRQHDLLRAVPTAELRWKSIPAHWRGAGGEYRSGRALVGATRRKSPACPARARG